LAFFKQAITTVGHKPERVTIDKHASYPQAIRHILGRNVLHRTNQYLNNGSGQDHRAVKQRYYPMRGFGSFASAARFCPAFDEVHQYFRLRSTSQKPLPLAEQRGHFRQRFTALIACYWAA
jgi:putative transposase